MGSVLLTLKSRAPNSSSQGSWPPRSRGTFVESGTFVVDRLEPGTYSVIIHFNADPPYTGIRGGTVVEIPESGTVEIDLPVRLWDRF